MEVESGYIWNVTTYKRYTHFWLPWFWEEFFPVPFQSQVGFNHEFPLPRFARQKVAGTQALIFVWFLLSEK